MLTGSCQLRYNLLKLFDLAINWMCESELLIVEIKDQSELMKRSKLRYRSVNNYESTRNTYIRKVSDRLC
jgi:hypothetical protein